MHIAVLKETCPGETRVAMVPALVPARLKAGHQISIESHAVAAAGYLDAPYQDQGACIVTDRSALIQNADAVFMVRGPACGRSTFADHLNLFRKGRLLIGFFTP